ncbi:hypothetical protein MMC25_000515 [Agyrium rufum]|nr:hypothetical protein [Agyrium rufum]
MKQSTILCAGALATTVSAINLVKPRGAAKVVSYDLHKKSVPGSSLRQRSVQLDYANKDASIYFVATTLGTPEQPIIFQLDTGSSSMLVYGVDSVGYCQAPTSVPCDVQGTFDYANSSTAIFLDDAFSEGFGDGQYFVGNYVADNVGLGSATLKNVTIGVGSNVTSNANIWGVGYAINQAQDADSVIYTTVFEAMVQQGIINSAAVSLYLNAIGDGDGTVLFGGVDTAKFEGELTTLPILPDPNGDGTTYREYIVTMETLTTNTQNASSSVLNAPVTALLDSGTSNVVLPTSILQALATNFGILIEDTNTFAVDCNYRDLPYSVTFGFGNNAAIDVPIASFINVPNEAGTCFLLAQPTGADDTEVILGDTFLRYAYTVFDQTNNEIHIAQAVPNVNVTNIMEIGAGPSGVPNVTEPVGGNATGAASPSGTGTATTGGNGTGVTSSLPTATLFTGGAQVVGANVLGVFVVGLVTALFL